MLPQGVIRVWGLVKDNLAFIPPPSRHPLALRTNIKILEAKFCLRNSDFPIDTCCKSRKGFIREIDNLSVINI